MQIDIVMMVIICWGWSGVAEVLGKLSVPGRSTILITVTPCWSRAGASY